MDYYVCFGESLTISVPHSIQVKLPTPCESLSALRPVQLVGGEQTLFAVTADGKVTFFASLVSLSFLMKWFEMV